MSEIRKVCNPGYAYILELRRASRTSDRQTRPLWLSVVVLEELYASHGFTIQTKNPRDFQLIAEFSPFDWEVV